MKAREVVEMETGSAREFLKKMSVEVKKPDIELRCYLQDNRTADGREVNNPDDHYDSVWIKAADWPKLQDKLWLEPIEGGRHPTFQSVDLYITELEGALDSLGVPHSQHYSDEDE